MSKAIASGLTADRTFTFPDANATVWTDQNSGNTAIGTMTTDVAGIANTATDGLVLQNSTVSTAGVPIQRSPRLRFRSNVWNTTAGGSNNPYEWAINIVPFSAATPGGLLTFDYALNGAGFTTGVYFQGGSIVLSASVVTPSLQFVTAGWLNQFASGKFTLMNPGQTAGVGLDVTTDAVLKVRTMAHGAYATVDALGYSVGGVAGASKGAGAVTSITVVNGLVTAIS